MLGSTDTHALNLVSAAASTVQWWHSLSPAAESKSKASAFGLTHSEHLPADTGDITACAWSADGALFAVATKKSRMRLLDGKTLALLHEWTLPDQDVAVCLRFIGKSRPHLLLGCRRRGMRLWDVAEKKEKELLPAALGRTITAGVDAMAVSLDEQHIAFGHGASGEVSVFNRTQSTLSTIKVVRASAAKSARAAGVAVLAYSTFKRSLLACGMTDGSVHLLDTSATLASKMVVKSFAQAHLAAVQTIAFSPFNRFLMVSVSLDKRMILYDVDQHKEVRTITADAPLTSLGFHSEGVILAAGTMDGRMLVYDLSARTKAPVWVGNAESASSVISIGFTPILASPPKKSTAEAKKTADGNDVTATPPSSGRSSASGKPSIADQSMNYMEMFSPVSKTQPSILTATAKVEKPTTSFAASLKAAAVPEKTEKPAQRPPLPRPAEASTKTAALKLKPALKLDDKITRRNDAEQKPSVEIVDSENQPPPQINQSADRKAEPVKMPSKPPLFVSKTSVAREAAVKQDSEMKMFSPLTKTTPQEAVKSSPMSSMPPTPTPAAQEEKKMQIDIAPMVTAAASIKSAETTAAQSTTIQTESKPVLKSSPVLPAAPKQQPQALPTKPAIKQSTVTDTDKAVDRLRDSIMQQASTAMSTSATQQQGQFSLSLLQSILDESLSTFRHELRRDVQNMHLELLKQFELQRCEIASLVHRAVTGAVRSVGTGVYDHPMDAENGQDDAGFWADLHRL